MDTKELLQKVKEIEIKTRGLTRQVFSGEYHSAFKGKGMTFSEVRDYSFGDDIRKIDWNVTARFSEPFIKVFEEERELTVMLICDISGSTNFGTVVKSKKQLLLELCAVLAFSAVANNDKVGAIFVTNKVEKFIPPKKGRAHAMRILRDLIEYEPEAKTTHLNEGIKFFTKIVNKRSIAFILSDFYDDNDFIEGLKIANRKHDIVALKLNDEAEKELPKMGIIQLLDSETGKRKWVNTSSKSTRNKHKKAFLDREESLMIDFRKSKIDYAAISTDAHYLNALMLLFKKRKK
ncbi:MAG: DUF58 domain-containing protein [Lishizhenia sp.]